MSSTKPLPTKLFIKENYRIILVNAPADYQPRLKPLPEGVTISTNLSKDSDFIQGFFMNREELEQKLGTLKAHLKQDG